MQTSIISPSHLLAPMLLLTLSLKTDLIAHSPPTQKEEKPSFECQHSHKLQKQ